MIITLPDERQVEITSIDFQRGLINFVWAAGETEGECAVPCEMEDIPSEEQIIAAIEAVIDPEGVNYGTAI